MPSKKWPNDKAEVVRFHKLTEPLRKAIDFAYTLERKNKTRTVPWTGYDIGDDLKAGSFSPHEALQCSNLRFNDEDQGRDTMDVLIGIAIQLGIEQGRRCERKDTKTLVTMLEIHSRALSGVVSDLKLR